ncbi:Na+/H+ antiporter NhaC [Treponema primitia ZAS-2]|uniref:Na+/H+ antiporter NhaC n=1 Tax=Treponema primitia (strain ATCC BAA-887 / DSM 12427 / ZAS-2) TaxID=545694 RepID=F5YQT3_TREPZ|nr:Na+/H+ antiporter NhaC [Treponema primitia]AEF83902.1 Na+/H+ antiporter NhaC [Treponema primitia ZAS-2]
MSKEVKKRTPRAPKIWEALLSFVVLIAVMSVGIAVFKVDPHIPMIIGTAFAAIMALWLGFDWKYIEKSMFDGIYQALQAVLILAVIGVLIGVWLVAGVVPTMIYYGLQIITPSLFLVASLLTCSITSLATGTSWGTCGTIGIALMGVASGLGIPLPMAAGAIISGAYFGDKMSPLSDTTNLAPAMAGTDVFTHVKFMLRSTIPVYTIVIIIYLILGFRFARGNMDVSNLVIITEGIRDNFVISPVLLIPPLVVILSIAKKMPAIPGIFLGIISGGILGALVQGNNFGHLLSSAYSGFVCETGVPAIDELLTAGGLENMMFSISLTILAMTFGGIMEKTGQLEVLVNQLIKLARGNTSLVGLTMLTCVASNATMPEQYISLVVPGRMYNSTYRRRNLHPKMLSNALEGSGTVTSALIPWNTCGVFLTGVLGVSTLEYLPWAFFNYLMPIAVLFMTALGLLTVKTTDDPGTIITPDTDDPVKLSA